MSYTSSEVKNRWNAQHYKFATFRLPKELGEEFSELAKANGDAGRSSVISMIEEFLEDNSNGKE